MIRDGRMPSPEQAFRTRKLGEKERRDKRNQQPAEARRIAERRAREKAWQDASSTHWYAERADNAQPPIAEALDEAFDFADPELWKSNSWAMLRPRLVVHQRAVVTNLEQTLAWTVMRAAAQPFSMYAGMEQRKRQREMRQREGDAEARQLQQRLDRAREILRALEAT
jgi:hypothetical protein